MWGFCFRVLLWEVGDGRRLLDSAPYHLDNAGMEASRERGTGLRRRLDLEVWSDVRVRHPS